jgi:hypothetical protein
VTGELPAPKQKLPGDWISTVTGGQLCDAQLKVAVVLGHIVPDVAVT